MTVLFYIVGIVVALLVIDAAWTLYSSAIDKIKARHYAEERERIVGILDDAAYWFCEDKSTEQLVRDLSKHLELYHRIDADAIRKTWRVSKKESA